MEGGISEEREREKLIKITRIQNPGFLLKKYKEKYGCEPSEIYRVEWVIAKFNSVGEDKKSNEI